MIVIYHCYGGAHSSVVGAALHLGLLPRDRMAAPDELWAVRYFDKQDRADHGRIRKMGVDEKGRSVCILGRRGYIKDLTRAVEAVASEFGVWVPGEVVYVDTLPCVNWSMRIGGFLSRAVGLRRIGRPLVIYGTRKAYPALRTLVRRTLADLDAREAGG